MSLIIQSTDVAAAKKHRVTSTGQVAVEISEENSRWQFHNYRVRNDAGMVPDRGFVKQLKKLNPDYEVVWDWGSSRWEIWEFQRDQPGRHVLTIQTANRSYRELGADILLNLQKYSWERFTPKQICDYVEEHNTQLRRRKMRDFSNNIQAIAKETFGYAQGILQVQVPRNANIPIIKNRVEVLI